MKLYATTTTERASKGQGGNDFLEVDILGENKQKLLKIKVKLHADGEFYILELEREGGNKIIDCSEMFITKTKGERQKGEERFCNNYGCVSYVVETLNKICINCNCKTIPFN